MSDLRAALPRIQQKVELQILAGPYAAAYSTVVDDVDSSGITVTHPLLGGRPVPLERGESVRVEYALSGAARIAFLSTVEAVHKTPYPIIRLAHPDPLRVARFQQRSFVRLPISMEVRYREVPDQGLPPKQGEAIDLSASGIQVVLPDVLEAGERLQLEFTLHGRPYQMLAEVVRQVDSLGPFRFAYGLRFLGIDEQQRQAILRFIFAEQREMRRQGLV